MRLQKQNVLGADCLKLGTTYLRYAKIPNPIKNPRQKSCADEALTSSITRSSLRSSSLFCCLGLGRLPQPSFSPRRARFLSIRPLLRYPVAHLIHFVHRVVGSGNETKSREKASIRWNSLPRPHSEPYVSARDLRLPPLPTCLQWVSSPLLPTRCVIKVPVRT